MRLLLLNGNTDPATTGLLVERAAQALPRLGLDRITPVPAMARSGPRDPAGIGEGAARGPAGGSG